MSKASRKAERRRLAAERRAQRSIARPSRDLGVVAVRAWATPELAIRVSGRIDVVLAVRLDAARSAWTYARSSMLAGGYLGTTSQERAVPIAELIASPPLSPLDDAPLEPIAVEAAAELVWGAFAWSQLRGALGDDGLPALGALPPPVGTFEDWAEALESKFSGSQLELADAIVIGADTENTIDDGEVPAVGHAVLDVDRPAALATALARNTDELVSDRIGYSYEWRPARDERSNGLVVIEDDTAMIRAVSALDTARLVMRLFELAPNALTLSSASWEPTEIVEPRISQVVVARSR